MANRRVAGRELIQIMTTRRSVREGFIDEVIDPDDLRLIVDCGLSAPSSKNAQPWRIHVVQSRSALNEIADLVVRANSTVDSFVPLDPNTGRAHTAWSTTVLESAHVLRQVPVGLFMENRGEFSHDRSAVAGAESVADAVLTYSLEVLGLGAAIENLLLAARALGLDAVFVGDILVAENAIRDRLGMVGDLVGVVAIGHTTHSEVAPRTRREDRVVWHDDGLPSSGEADGHRSS